MTRSLWDMQRDKDRLNDEIKAFKKARRDQIVNEVFEYWVKENMTAEEIKKVLETTIKLIVDSECL